MKKMILGLVVGAMIAGVVGVSVSEARPDYSDMVEVTGILERVGDDYFVNGMELELGDRYMADVDYDGDGKSMPIKGELYGLVGKTVIIKGYKDRDKNDVDDMNDIYVTEINGQKYHAQHD